MRLFFWVWTMKEAYTKALGLGLGFDFSRIEYDVPRETLTVDGAVPPGWQITKFEIAHGRDAYQGVAARYVGGDTATAIVSRESQEAGWLVEYGAAEFVTRAIAELH